MNNSSRLKFISIVRTKELANSKIYPRAILVFFSILLAFLYIYTASAETSVSGTISSNTTWTLANSPYTITGSVTVASGVTLTIEPGVEIKFDSNKALEVEGTLIAKGTSSDKITFTSSAASPAAGDWGFIQFTNTSADATFDGNGDYTGGSILEHCIIEYGGGSGVEGSIDIDQSVPFINYCTIRYSASAGIKHDDESIKVHNSTITQNNSNGIFSREYNNGSPPYTVSIINNTV